MSGFSVIKASYMRKLNQGYTKSDFILYKRALRQPLNSEFDLMFEVPCYCQEREICDACRMIDLRSEYGGSLNKRMSNAKIKT